MLVPFLKTFLASIIHLLCSWAILIDWCFLKTKTSISSLSHLFTVEIYTGNWCIFYIEAHHFIWYGLYEDMKWQAYLLLFMINVFLPFFFSFCSFTYVIPKFVQAVNLFKSYFGGAFDEDAIRNNFVLIYELLDGTCLPFLFHEKSGHIWRRFYLDIYM